MWLGILSLVLGAVPAITKEIMGWQERKLSAKTEHEKIEAEQNIAALTAKRDVLIAESKTPWNALTRGLIAAPFIIYFWWIIPYDKIICKWVHAPELVDAVCRTDPLGPWLEGIAASILAFFFVTLSWKR